MLPKEYNCCDVIFPYNVVCHWVFKLRVQIVFILHESLEMKLILRLLFQEFQY